MKPEVRRKLRGILKLDRGSKEFRLLNRPWEEWKFHSEETIQILIQTLEDPSEARRKEQVTAARILGEAPLTSAQAADAARALSVALNHWHTPARKRMENRLRRIGSLLAIWAATLWIAIGGCTLLWPLINNQEPNPLIGLIVGLDALFTLIAGGMAIALVFILPWSLSKEAEYDRRVREAAAIALGRLRVAEGVSALAGAFTDSHPTTHRLVEAALQAVLPRLREDHYGLLGSEIVPNLCRALNYEQKTLILSFERADRLMLNLLEALGKVGDSRALSTVQRIADEGRTDQAQAAARKILPILKERQQQEQARGMLLRGATQPMVPPESLLRPALSDSQTTAPTLLLRPSVSGAENRTGE